MFLVITVIISQLLVRIKIFFVKKAMGSRFLYNLLKCFMQYD